MAAKTERHSGTVRVYRIALAASSIVQLWPTAPKYIRCDDVGDAWRATGDYLRDAMMEIERERRKEIHAGSETRSI